MFGPIWRRFSATLWGRGNERVPSCDVPECVPSHDVPERVPSHDVPERVPSHAPGRECSCDHVGSLSPESFACARLGCAANLTANDLGERVRVRGRAPGDSTAKESPEDTHGHQTRTSNRARTGSSASARARQRSTEPEQLLWGVLRNRRLGGHKFRRQHSVGASSWTLCASSRNW